MNCDQAFDQMTSPHRSNDQALAVHLSGCPRCREMLSTLEPALGLLQSDSVDTLYAMPWDVASEGREVATQAALRLAPTETPRRRLSSLWGYGAAVALGAGLVWGTMALTPSPAAVSGAHSSHPECLYLADCRPSGMTGRQMTQSCLACHTVTER